MRLVKLLCLPLSLPVCVAGATAHLAPTSDNRRTLAKEVIVIQRAKETTTTPCSPGVVNARQRRHHKLHDMYDTETFLYFHGLNMQYLVCSTTP